MSNDAENRAAKERAEGQSTECEGAHVVDSAARRSRRGFRFGLLELLLLTAVIAAWIPVIIARRQIPSLETEIGTMRLATRELIVMDPLRLNVRTLPSIWHNISSWKYAAPPGADLELRLATEGINSIAFPADYQAVALPEGEHSIHLKVTSDGEGYHTEVFIDEELVLQKHPGRDWLKSFGSSSSGGVSEKSTAYPIDQPLNLKLQRHSVEHPLQKYQSVEVPDEYDNKGNYLWISPRTIVPEPPSAFFVPRNKYSQDATGHRQGIQVSRSSQGDLKGLICIQPSLDSTLGDQRLRGSFPFGISVRPVLEGEGEPEVPEEQGNAAGAGTVGIPISLRDTISPPEEYDDASVNELVTTNAIIADGKQMRLFAHFKPFASGARPIIEILFDAKHPDRVGFLPHAAPDSLPMKACQLVTRFDARFFWRSIELLPDSERDPVPSSATPSLVPLSQLYTKSEFSEPRKSKPAERAPLSWQNIPLARLPRLKASETTEEMFRFSLITDVANVTKLKFPLGLRPKWQYKGIANRQVWWLPKAMPGDGSSAGIEIDVRATPVFPTTTLPLPGGPAIGNVRITIPMPAKKPVWLEITAE